MNYTTTHAYLSDTDKVSDRYFRVVRVYRGKKMSCLS